MALVDLKERAFKVVLDGVEKSYRIIKPNFLQGNRADLVRKKAFTEALREGLMTAIQMREFLEKNEFYSKSSTEIDRFDEEILAECARLKDFTTEEEATPVVLHIKELRALKMVETFKLNSIYENTAEIYADSIRNQFYASELARDDKGGRVWKTYEEFREKASDQLAQEALLNVMLFMARIADNYQMEYEENKFLLKLGIIDKEGNYIKKELPPQTPEVAIAAVQPEVTQSTPVDGK